MSWPNDRTLSRALHELLTLVDLGNAWTDGLTDHGPTEHGLALYDGGSSLSPAQRAMLYAAFSVWNPGNEKGTVGLVLHALDTARLDALLSLCFACQHGEPAVEAWIAHPALRRGRGPATDVEHALLSAALERDPPDDIRAWTTRTLPGASREVAERVSALYLAGAFGRVEHVGDLATHDPPRGGGPAPWPRERSLGRALHALLAFVELGDVWTEAGPRARARTLYERGGVSTGQGAMLCAAFSIWKPKTKKGTLGLAVHKLNRTNLDALLSLALACHGGDEAVETWTARAGARRSSGPATPLEHALVRAAMGRDPPGDDLMASIVRALPGAQVETVLNVWQSFLRGIFGDVEHVGDEQRSYAFPGGTLGAVPLRLVRTTSTAARAAPAEHRGRA